jgi:hypothetical protein
MFYCGGKDTSASVDDVDRFIIIGMWLDSSFNGASAIIVLVGN